MVAREHEGNPAAGGGHRHPADRAARIAEWDARYAEAERTWSGRPNEALVAELADEPPGRVLDVGCGEGADAVWLASRGWEVTAIDVSAVALRRARAAAEASGVRVTFLQLDLADAGALGAFDAVSACYAPLDKSPGRDAERALAGAVAPGGVLLWVHHADVDRARAAEHGFDPDDYLSDADVLAALEADRAAGWVVETHARRARHVTEGAGAHHRDDVVVRARRGWISPPDAPPRPAF